ncbi:putative kinetochore protein SPC25 [Kluyveromyces marxianus]|uniref:Kinetochore protein SPC25 n=1 Tax=Kluyveromyces marxianus (strain DMKU3-1042 / BCC 29191 / NBRC 104275) TaxID=1003335 RepID=W0T2S5_KLUMD|nr:probable kinetochore protein SPC25 [Kluyveromyces marxianus DMKU3-1042]KAG0677714.1 kinetochore-associated Ndc80 complex subunit spc25 [Kluyveromyces marxianus]BAO37715.1 probable kinetochore protein SPC25 [Kluyveromyces marxianus DMKU3-1042]BAP69283.1 probable kinetochore protein SPC25 [Kluyveromyces marxianus]
MGIDEFSDLKSKMDGFQTKMDKFLEKSREELSVKTERYWGGETEKLRLIETLRGKLEELETRRVDLREDFESSQREANEANAQSKAYHTKLEKLKEERDFLRKEVEKLEVLLHEQARDLEREKESRELQSGRDEAEVEAFEKLLGLSISASVQDVITFTFTGDSNCWISLDVSGDGYKIAASQPQLPHVAEKDLVDQLSATDDLRVFLKSARSLLLSVS